jgi:small subunit ribosomal protein S18
MAQPKQRGQTNNTRRRQPADAMSRRRNCAFCREQVDEVDYKNLAQLRRYVSERGRIRSSRITGTCRRHQVQLASAVKRAREMALLPYVEAE